MGNQSNRAFWNHVDGEEMKCKDCNRMLCDRCSVCDVHILEKDIDRDCLISKIVEISRESGKLVVISTKTGFVVEFVSEVK